MSDDLDDRDRELLEWCRTYWVSVTTVDDARRCDRLYKAGLLERKKQSRRGFPTMYRTVES
jgi:hypothetical protein